MREPTDEDADRPDPPEPHSPAAVLDAFDATIIVADGEPVRCTIHPTDATDAEQTTRWITADEESFVGLGAMR